MGVPFMALAGNSYGSRQGLMLLNNMGRESLVARTRTRDQYVRFAIETATNTARLAGAW
jgi:predicted O-linked N-acetylglucosamine transferase (SPINDLY family)